MNRLIAIFLATGLLGAQEIPPDMTKAASTFLEAVASNDGAKLATVSQFPIRSNEFKTIATTVELKNAFPVIFTKERKAGLIGQKPIPRTKGIYALSSKDQNDPIQFLFKKFGHEFKLYLIDNINE